MIPRLRFSLLSIFLLTALVAGGAFLYQRHLAWQAAQAQFSELIATQDPTAENVELARRMVTRYPQLAQTKGALCWIIRHGDAEACRQFLEAGASPNDVGSVINIPALEWAVHRGAPGVVPQLLEAGANKVEHPILPLGASTHTTLLHQAILQCDTASCQALIDHGYDVNVVDGREDTPLHLAVKFRHIPAVELLLANGATLLPNSRGQTPFDIAIQQQDATQIIDLLQQPDVNLRK